MSQQAAQILTRDDGATIAYHHNPGKLPGIMFCTGFKSDMQGGKAIALEAFCRERDRAFTRFDYFGHGESSGAFEDGTIGRWAEDAIAVLDEITQGRQIIVGSSMGGWIMLLVALARAERVAGLVGIAAAPDFTEEMLTSSLTVSQLNDIETKGYCDIPNCYDDQEPYRIRRELLEEGKNHLLLDNEIAINVPVRLIHGIEDEDVPWQRALQIMERLHSTDVEIQFIKNAGHRLSEPDDLARMLAVVESL